MKWFQINQPRTDSGAFRIFVTEHNGKKIFFSHLWKSGYLKILLLEASRTSKVLEIEGLLGLLAELLCLLSLTELLILTGLLPTKCLSLNLRLTKLLLLLLRRELLARLLELLELGPPAPRLLLLLLGPRVPELVQRVPELRRVEECVDSVDEGLEESS